MPNENNSLEKALLVQVETTKVRRILNFENSFEEFKDLASSAGANILGCLLYTSPSPRDRTRSRMPTTA